LVALLDAADPMCNAKLSDRIKAVKPSPDHPLKKKKNEITILVEGG